MSDDGQYLFVATATKIQRFLLPALTLDVTADLPGRAQLTPQPGMAPELLTVRPGDPRTITVDGAVLTDFVPVSAGLSLATTLQWSADGNTLYGSARINGANLALWSIPFGSSVPVTDRGTPFSHPFAMNVYPIPEADFQLAGGRFYSDSGAVFDPATGGWPGTLPLSQTFGLADPTGDGYAVAKLALDIPRRRAYAVVCKAASVHGACGNSLVSFDIDSYLPVTIGDVPTVRGWAYRLQELSPASFALVSADRKLVLVKAAEYAR
jgi:hypothetical protein